MGEKTTVLGKVYNGFFIENLRHFSKASKTMLHNPILSYTNIQTYVPMPREKSQRKHTKSVKSRHLWVLVLFYFLHFFEFFHQTSKET